MSKKKERRLYYFPIELCGEGCMPEEAWEDAIEAFMQDPGGYEKFIEGESLE